MGFKYASCTSSARLDGKVAVITGCNGGIGKETAKDFYLRGCHVIMACRDTEKANEALEDIKRTCLETSHVGKLEVVELNLGNMQSIRDCAEKLTNKDIPINLLVNNAGIFACPFSRTDDGFEIQFGTNHLGHFLLTLLLLPTIIKSRPSRIVNVSSLVHARGHLNFEDLNWRKRNYNTMSAYNESKLAIVLFTKELSRRLEGANIQGVHVYSLHPGLIVTNAVRHLDESYCPGLVFCWKVPGRLILKSAKQGAQTTIHCAVDEKAGEETGLYYSDCKVKTPSRDARNMEYAGRLWEESVKLVGLDTYDPFDV